jgi:nitroreductase
MDSPASAASKGTGGEAGILGVLRRRRVCRSFTGEPVAESHLWQVLEAARQATSASNVRIHRFLVIRGAERIRLVRLVSPGMLGNPAALIVICTDLNAAAAADVHVDRDSTVLIDVGTAAMNMMLAAEALQLGTCPLTSFSRPAVSEVLELPAQAVPEFILQLGHRRPQQRVMPQATTRRLPPADLAYWERYGNQRAQARPQHPSANGPTQPPPQSRHT